MRVATRYEAELAELCHEQNHHQFDWKFSSANELLDEIARGEKLCGKEYVVVFNDNDKVVAEEYDLVSEMIDVPHDCLVFTRQQIERHFYDRHEWLVECFA